MFPEKLTGAEENPQEENPQEENRKGRKRFIEGVEEDPPEENPIFKPADLPHFQDGVDICTIIYCAKCGAANVYYWKSDGTWVSATSNQVAISYYSNYTNILFMQSPPNPYRQYWIKGSTNENIRVTSNILSRPRKSKKSQYFGAAMTHGGVYILQGNDGWTVRILQIWNGCHET